MNDTRLHQISALLADARTLLAELLDEDIDVYHHVDLSHADHQIDRAQGFLGRVM
jgi:hypothetical protein